MTYDASQIAQFMMDRLSKLQFYSQEHAAMDIRQAFGDEPLYRNKNHNWAIKKDVLDAFSRISGPDVVWSRSDRRWRFRAAFDKPGRLQR